MGSNMPSAIQSAIGALTGNRNGLPNMDPSQWLSPLQSAVSNIKPIDYTAPNSTPYQAQDVTKITNPMFDSMRSRLNQQYSQAQGEGQDAIDRQFAAMGGGPGNGAQAKQTENLVSGIAKQQGQDLAGLNAQQEQANLSLNQQEQQKAFESQEAQKARDAQSAQFGTQVQEFNQELPFQAQEDVAKLGETSAADLFNTQVAQYQTQHSGGLFGGGGFLGLGSWFCTEAGKVMPLFSVEKKALKKLLHYCAKKDRSTTKMYLKECKFLIPKVRSEKWVIWNNHFVRGICLKVLTGNLEEAYLDYRSYFFNLLSITASEVAHA